MGVSIGALVPLVANLGLLAILAWVYSVFSVRISRLEVVSGRNRSVILGVAFGLGSALLMNMPVELQPGIFGDARGAPILLSGILGGPVAGLLTTGIGVAARYQLGGLGATGGCIYIMIFGAVGVGYHYLAKRWDAFEALDIRWLLSVSLAATAISMPVVFLLPPDLWAVVVTKIWPQLLGANLIGTAILGSLVRREDARVRLQIEMAEQERLARAGTAAKSRFLASMSHEIRTPLNAILGVMQLMERQELPRQAKDDLRVAREAGIFLVGLINQVLDFAKIEGGVVTLNPERFSLGALTSNLQSIFAGQAQKKGLRLEFVSVKEADGTFVADHEKIQQVLFNLVGNAMKFTEQGGIDVSVRVRRISASTRQTGQGENGASDYGSVELEFEVRDTGPGIAEADQTLIFEEFGQTETGRLEVNGTGLGLSISSRLADAMGGTLSVRSEPGKGATFIFTVPVELPDAAGGAADPGGDSGRDVVFGRDLMFDRDPASSLRTSEHHARPLRVLVVEDNSVNRMLARRFLEEDGHAVDFAINGEEATRRVIGHESDFDVVLMDIQMPVMDGVEATKLILGSNPSVPKPPIFALTANVMREQVDEYKRIGMKGVIGKPFRRSEIQALLAELGGNDSRAFQTTKGSFMQDDNGFMKDQDGGRIRNDLLVEAARVMTDGNVAQLCDLIEEQVMRLLKGMEEAGGDRAAIASMAHEIAGMLDNFGFKQASHDAGELETAARSEVPISGMLEAFDTGVRQDLDTVKKHLGTIDA
jgi:signal transduction histidine kinase/CheY-like chemotaxis protein/HPt (histidine-containing phosphotransfer) domain-containing protein